MWSAASDAHLRICTISGKVRASVIRTIIEWRRGRSIPTTCRPSYDPLETRNFVSP